MHTIFLKQLAATIIFTALCSLNQSVFAQDSGLNWEDQTEPNLIIQPILKLDTAMYWENQPEDFNVKGRSVSIRTNCEKYLWGDSHEFDFDFPYSHFYYRSIAGNFTVETTMLLTNNWNYGNAGLLIKLSHSNWIKLYVGKEMNILSLNTVYASDTTHIDYCTTSLRTENNKIWLRINCNNGELCLKYSTNGLAYETLRILNMPASYKYAQVGLMADSPMSIGFDASFENFEIGNKAENQ